MAQDGVGDGTDRAGDSGPAGRVITISAAYGASGSLIAPAVAARLGLPFADRLIPARGPDQSAFSEAGEQLSDEERLAGRRTSFLDRLAYLTGGLGLPVPAGDGIADHVREQVERSVADIAAGAGGVILGRGAMLILAGHPGAFHVRLDGPDDRRCARAMALENIDEATARDRLAETDSARARYFSRIYGLDAADPSLYHLIVDSTVLPVDVCVRLIVDAASGFWGRR
ncbi:MAG TPA: cytidylate kinase-like family protein [Acidimicrobiia bacterium]|nr:cytidylate kinase-like family protein [Acidimicrobiia bacterium]